MKEPIFFYSPSNFRDWLEQNHKSETELLVGYHKVNSGKESMTWPESVDEALCFGWIDGVRRSLGEDSYTIRFTPRKPKSIWSAVNLKKMEELMAQGKMQEAGLAVFILKDENKLRIYSYERETALLSAEFEEMFKANEKAWAFFSAQPAGYKKVIIYWVVSAKQEATRLSRLEKLIRESEKHNRLR